MSDSDTATPVYNGMIVADYKQGSPEWLDWRSQGVTASDIPIILGLSPYKTVWQLWAEKVGRINAADISRNPNVIRGNRLEDNARQLAEMHCGDILLPVCGEYGQWPTLRASFDGLDSDPRPHEFKAPSDAIWNDLLDKGKTAATYQLYEAQVHAQCLVSGSSSGRLMFFKENDADGEEQTFDVELSQEKADEILSKAKWFWGLVESETPPQADPEKDWFIPEDGDARFRWEAQSDAWRINHQRIKSLKDQMKALEESQKSIQKEMITLMGPFMQADFGGVKISRFTKKGSVDYSAFMADWFPKLDAHVLDEYRKASRDESRFTMSEDELVNTDVNDVITNVQSGFF